MKEENERISKIRKLNNRRRNVKIAICAIVLGIIGVTAFFTLKDNFKPKSDESSQTSEIHNKNDDKQKEKALKVARKKFEELGEKVNEKDLEILKIERKGEFYYYISSKENTVEVRISDNKITRVNSVVVDK
jgi:uncharacterized membrane protein YhiD involved in acid resistance